MKKTIVDLNEKHNSPVSSGKNFKTAKFNLDSRVAEVMEKHKMANTPNNYRKACGILSKKGQEFKAFRRRLQNNKTARDQAIIERMSGIYD